MSDNEYREVNFNKYCPKCRYSKFPETEDPCDECLGELYNTESHKPVNFKSKNIDGHDEEFELVYSEVKKKYGAAIGNVFDI